LFIPLVFGMFVVVPPQIYYEHINDYPNYAAFYKTVFDFVPYPKGSFSWHHLWFVVYLLLYSLLAIPLLVYLRSRRSIVFRDRVMRYLSSPAGIIFIPFAIILATQILLRPFFPEEMHDLINDWAYFVYYACFFVFGMIAYSNPLLWQSIGANRRHLLAAGSFFIVLLYVIYFHYRGLYQLPGTPEELDTAFNITAIMVAWTSLITVIAYGQHYLNRPHPLLPHFNQGLYPFYILHQTVIIMIGYYICQLDWGIGAKFWTVSLLTLVACVGFYWVFIQSNNVMRFLFGVKAKKS
jgi:glucan biosynthesis protein C